MYCPTSAATVGIRSHLTNKLVLGQSDFININLSSYAVHTSSLLQLHQILLMTITYRY